MSRTMHSSGVASAANIRKKQTMQNSVLAKKPVKHEAGVKGAVFSIDSFTTMDGPGIRTNIFVQGCQKRCLFCCNPETLELIDPETNPEFAMTDIEIARMLAHYQGFLKPNNGGLTISGGEPLVQPKFVAAVFKRVHEDLGLTTCLDTASHGGPEVWDEVLPHTDFVLLCLKGMDSDVARKVAGVSAGTMEQAKEFARHIHAKYPNIRITLRWVLLKGMTDTPSEMEALVEFAKELSPVVEQIALIPYHELGVEKYKALNIAYPLEGTPPYDIEEAKKLHASLQDQGVKVVLEVV
jgi:pyruvate formate lyase activating enzyme